MCGIAGGFEARWQGIRSLSQPLFHGLMLPRMTRRRLVTAIVSLLPIFFLGGCKPRNAAPQAARTLVLLSAHGSRPYELAQNQALSRYVFSRDGYNLKTLDAAGDAELQARQFEEAVAEKPVAILVVALEAKSLAASVSSAVQQGILVMGLGAEAASLPCSTHLLVDQRELGRLAGDLTVKALTQKAREEGQGEAVGRVVELRGDEGSMSEERHEGFMEALKKAPGVILVHDAPAQWSRQGGLARAQEALRLQKQFDVVYAHNDSIALGASSGLGDARSQVLVIGTDGFRGEEGGLTLVNEGSLDASVHQPLLVDLAWAIILRRAENPAFAPKPSYRVNASLITPKNVDEFRVKGPPPLPEL